MSTETDFVSNYEPVLSVRGLAEKECSGLSQEFLSDLIVPGRGAMGQAPLPDRTDSARWVPGREAGRGWHTFSDFAWHRVAMAAAYGVGAGGGDRRLSGSFVRGEDPCRPLPFQDRITKP